MPLLINFKDAVDASVLDPNAQDAVYYMDGLYENRAAVHARCPKARLHAITTRGATGHGIFACDSETGDLPIPQTEQWVVEQVHLVVSPIVVYANQDRWLNLGLLKVLAKYGNRIERWDADYDGSAVIPSWASAKQYATGSVDLNIARAGFFNTPAPAFNYHYKRFPTLDVTVKVNDKYVRLVERDVVTEYDLLRAHPRLHHDKLLHLRYQLQALQRRIAELNKTRVPAVTAEDWGVWRAHQLYIRGFLAEKVG